MDTYVLVVGAALSLLIGRIWFGLGRGRDELINRQLARRRQIPMAEAREGPVCFTGHTKAAAGMIEAPITGRQCFAFRVMVSARSGNSWAHALELTQSGPFLVTDGTGEVWVDPAGSDWIVLQADVAGQVGGFFGRATPDDERRRLGVLLRSKGIETTTFFGGAKRFSFDERILGVEAAVVVAGVALWEATSEGERPTPRGAGERLALRNTPEHPVVLSNAPQARARRS